MENALPAIPPKRYFTIGEVSELCGVKPYVLRYWEQEFTQLRPMKRRGNRRYYQHHEVLLIRRIRDLLYEQGFTISGARNRLAELGAAASQYDEGWDVGEAADLPDPLSPPDGPGFEFRSPVQTPEAGPPTAVSVPASVSTAAPRPPVLPPSPPVVARTLRDELLSIRALLDQGF
jgi:DNA-binding transcriptional MerR regulator